TDEVRAIRSARGRDECHVCAGALQLTDVGAHVRGVRRIPELLGHGAAGIRERTREAAAILPAEGVVDAEGCRRLISLAVGPLSGREARLAAAERARAEHQ